MSSEKLVFLGESKSSPLFVDTKHFDDLDKIASDDRGIDIEKFGEKLQLVLKLEHATIPPYLTAAYSLEDGNSQMRSLMIRAAKEEMFHMTVIANLMNAIGVSPNLRDPKFVPKYPGPLPLLDKRHPLNIGVESFYRNKEKSDELLEVFMRIEASENPLHYRVVEGDPRAKDRPRTIGDLYNKIIDIIKTLPNDAFEPGKRQQHRQLAHYPHHHGGDVNPQFKKLAVEAKGDYRDYSLPNEIDFRIYDQKSAVKHLKWIMEEGEGTRTAPAGSDDLPAHYYRFTSARYGRYLVEYADEEHPDEEFAYAGASLKLNPNYVVEFDPSPHLERYKRFKDLHKAMETFRNTYGEMLGHLHSTFNAGTEAERRDHYRKVRSSMRMLKRVATGVRIQAGKRQGDSLKGGLCYGPPT